jgi:cellulose synthase/poly-beta-1,6-N-acetylglucosamine synthase-like glycosyltransferase/exo-beta-1,3-glucanase (GH17 family)
MKKILIAAFVAAAAATVAWQMLYERTVARDLAGGVASLSYNFISPQEHGEIGNDVATVLHRVDQDLSALARMTRIVRLYASGGVFSRVPRIARTHGFSVIAGAWISGNPAVDREELAAAVNLVNRNPNVRSLVVGNETILRKEQTVPQLVQLLRQTRRQVRAPVSTGETWDIWLKHPELAAEVDFVAAHILPYWEGIAAKDAVAHAMARYEDLRAAFPGKRIVIAEFGWPSQGYNNRAADAGPALQAKVIGDFIAEANRRGIAYNVIEAIDQPWKGTEGSVGAYWGLFDADRHPKFTLEGSTGDDRYFARATLAVILGLAISVLVGASAGRRSTFPQALAVATAAQGMAVGVSLAALYPFENYLNSGSAIAWAIGIALMIPLTAMTLVKVHEVAEITLGRTPARLIRRPVAAPGSYRLPKVSVHVPACREKPDMLMATMDSLAALEYPDYEVLVIVNNTPEETLWKPIEAHCARLGERFRFVHLPRVDGFKAGALNAAIAATAADAEILAVVDADYVVAPNWLSDLVPAFADPTIGLVQAPQDHRDGGESVFKAVMNSEYAGFFDIGMVQRNEDDAIIAHGTMLLVRRSAFAAVGGWGTDTITEDTELGLRLYRAGWRARYTARRYGRGLLPDTFAAFKTQRERWAYGAVQIIRKHWRAMLPGSRDLTAAQKFQFVAGWSLWLSDSFGVIAAYLNLLWVPMILFVGVLIPMLPFTLPIIGMFAVNILHCGLLYGIRVKLPPRQILGAALAAMSLQMTVARGVAKGFGSVNMPFLRTDKGGIAALAKRTRKVRPAGTEAITGGALLAGAGALFLTNETEMVEINVFAATLLVQSLPFVCAPLIFGLERLARRSRMGARPAASAPAPVPPPAVETPMAA